MRRALIAVLCLAMAGTVVLMPSAASAQTAREGRVQVTVVDPSGLVVPEAVVTIVGLEPATQALTLPDVRTTDKGVAILERVPPGRYSIRAEFPGFDLGLLRDIRVRAGENRHVVILPLQKLEDAVTVSRDAQAAAADRRSSDFGVNLSQDRASDRPGPLPHERVRQHQQRHQPPEPRRIQRH